MPKTKVVKCLCSPPGCKDIEEHIRKIRKMGETDERMIAMIRSGKMASKILKPGEKE